MVGDSISNLIGDNFLSEFVFFEGKFVLSSSSLKYSSSNSSIYYYYTLSNPSLVEFFIKFYLNFLNI